MSTEGERREDDETMPFTPEPPAEELDLQPEPVVGGSDMPLGLGGSDVPLGGSDVPLDVAGSDAALAAAGSDAPLDLGGSGPIDFGTPTDDAGEATAAPTEAYEGMPPADEAIVGSAEDLGDRGEAAPDDSDAFGGEAAPDDSDALGGEASAEGEAASAADPADALAAAGGLFAATAAGGEPTDEQAEKADDDVEAEAEKPAGWLSTVEPYTVLLGVALMALIVGLGCLAMELYRYDFKYKRSDVQAEGRVSQVVVGEVPTV